VAVKKAPAKRGPRKPPTPEPEEEEEEDPEEEQVDEEVNEIEDALGSLYQEQLKPRAPAKKAPASRARK
jgi:hypothetical protein